MIWQEFSLTQLTDRFLSGGTPNTKVPEYWNGDIPWITGADFSDGEAVLGRRYVTKAGVESSATNIVPKGAILMVTRTGVGKVAIAPLDVAVSQDITGIILKRGILTEYIVAAIRSKMNVLLAAQRGATIKGITRKDLEELRIPLPPPSEQRRIVEILDQADALRKKRAEADAKAQRILPALFHHMFGDPATNPKGWPIATIEQLLEIPPNYGTMIPGRTTLRGWLDIRVANIAEGRLDLNDRKYVELQNNDVRRHEVRDGDLLLARAIGSADHLGKCFVAYPAKEKWAFDSHIMRIRFDLRKAVPEFIKATLESPGGRTLFLQNTRHSAVQFNINAGEFCSLRIPLPPISLQRNFRVRSCDVASIQGRQNDGRCKLDTLFHAILHRAFTGDLTAKWREAHVKELLQEMEKQARCLLV